MKIAVISDLHGFLPEYPNTKFWEELSECELLLICGDIVPLSVQTDMQGSKWWLLEKFKPWAASLPVEKVLFIGGNHDFICERKKKEIHEWFSRHDKVTYLHNEWYDHISVQDSKVYRVFGTPYCKIFGNWAFMRGNDILRTKYWEMPENVDILISHDAPMIEEVGVIHQGWQRGTDAGNEVLAEAILEKKPKYCFCGHIHSGDHNIIEHEGIKFANTSIVDERYELTYPPAYVRL